MLAGIKRLTVGQRWFLSSALLLLVAVVPFGVYQASTLRAHLEAQVWERLEIQGTAVHDQVAQFLALQRHVVWSTARLMADELEEGREGRVHGLLKEARRRGKNVSAFILVDRQGRAEVADPAKRFDGGAVAGVSYRDRSYFNEAVAGEGVAVGNVVMGRSTGIPTLGFAYALRDPAGEVQHVLIAGFDLEHFQVWLDRQLKGRDLQVLILDRKQRVIAGRARGRSATFTDASRVDLYSVASGVVKGVDYAGDRVLASVSTVEELGWRVVVTAPLAKVERAVMQTIGETVLMGVLALAGAMGLSLVIARSMSKPIDELRKGFQVVTKGNLNHVVDAGTVPEFEQIAAAFNKMTRALAERNRALEESQHGLQVALAQAEQANRLKSEFLANVSHELRTPLNAIVNIPRSLLGEYQMVVTVACRACGVEESDVLEPTHCQACGSTNVAIKEELVFEGEFAEHHHFLKRLDQSGRHLLEVVNDLLDFSKIEAGFMELRPEDLKVEVLLEAVLEGMSTFAAERGIVLDVDVPPSFPEFNADGVRVQQVLLNLVSNAIKFTEAPGTVTIQVKAEARQGREGLYFEVKDTGIGIPQDKLQLVFESFRQVDGSHTRRQGGMGLGLAISKRLVELHGGEIGVASIPGEGSSFWFWLPKEVVRSDEQAAA